MLGGMAIVHGMSHSQIARSMQHDDYMQSQALSAFIGGAQDHSPPQQAGGDRQHVKGIGTCPTIAVRAESHLYIHRCTAAKAALHKVQRALPAMILVVDGASIAITITMHPSPRLLMLCQAVGVGAVLYSLLAGLVTSEQLSDTCHCYD